jgi:hypothetical protein
MTYRAVEQTASDRDAEPAPIDLIPVRPGAWRACDARFGFNQVESLVGFVEERGDQVEVMVIGEHFSWALFATMTEAVEYLQTEGAESAEQRREGPMAGLRTAAAHAVSS